jgi:hypothetical protein
MNSWTPTTSKTKNWAAYNRALKQRGSLSIWFDTEMDWDATPSGNRGRQQVDSDAAIQACLTTKVLFGLPLRQATGFVESLLKLVSLDWPVPDFSTLIAARSPMSWAHINMLGEYDFSEEKLRDTLGILPLKKVA